MKVYLNVQKIRAELKRLGWSQRYLAKRIHMSPALLNYHLQSKSIIHAKKIAKPFNLDAKDLIIIRDRAA